MKGITKYPNRKKPEPLTKEHREKMGSKDEKNPAWKGDKVGYDALHRWIRRKLGEPKCCEFCLTSEDRKYEWASISHQYVRDLTDWVRLCTPCHRRFDFSRN